MLKPDWNIINIIGWFMIYGLIYWCEYLEISPNFNLAVIMMSGFMVGWFLKCYFVEKKEAHKQ